MDETKKIWMDGKLVDWQDAKIHLLTHTFHYGGGVFEGIRFYDTVKGPAVFRLKEHTERLFRSAEPFRMKIPFTLDEIMEATRLTVRVNELRAGYIRPIVYYGYGKMGLAIQGAVVNVAIAVWPWGSYLGDDAVRVKITDIRRTGPATTFTFAKICGNYANSILASIEAKEAGFDEALLLDDQDHVAEGPGENLFIVKDKVLLTPPLGAILPGITRSSIMELAPTMGFKVEERVLMPKDVFKADEAFFTGTAAEVTPIKQVNDATIGSGEAGPVTKALGAAFKEVVSGKRPEYHRWLAFV